MDNSEKPSSRLHDSLRSSRTLQRCKICKKSFRHPDVYIAHLSLHKKATTIQKARLYACRICASSHRGLSAFLEHQKSHVTRVSTASISSKRSARLSDVSDETEAILTAAADTGLSHRCGAAPLNHDGGTSVAAPAHVSVSREGIHNFTHQYGSSVALENSNLSNVRSNMSVSSAMSLVAALCSVNNPLLGHSHASSMLGSPLKPGSSEGIQIEIPTQVKTIHLSSGTPSLADVVKLINLLSNKIDALIKHFQVPIDEDGNLVALETASIEIENSTHKEIHEAQNETDTVIIEGYPPSYSIIQAAKEQQQQEYYALALGQQGSGSSLRLEIPDSPVEGKQLSKSRGGGKTIDLWIPPTSQYFSTLPVIGESNSPDSVEAQNYVIPQSVIEKVFLESRSRGNFAKNLLFAICSPEERRGKNCSGRVYGKATPKGRLDQGKLNAVKEVTMRKYPCHTSLVDITWKKECVTAIDSGLRNENRLSRTSEHGQDILHDHHLQAIHAIECDSSKMQDLPAGQMGNGDVSIAHSL